MIDAEVIYYHSQIYDPLLHGEELPASNKPEKPHVKVITRDTESIYKGRWIIGFLQHWMNTSLFARSLILEREAVQWKDTPRRRWRCAAGYRCSGVSGAEGWHLRTHGRSEQALIQWKRWLGFQCKTHLLIRRLTFLVWWLWWSDMVSVITIYTFKWQLTLSDEDRIFQVCGRWVVIVHLIRYKDNEPKRQMVSG